jgi:transposase-like protein
MNCPHCSSTQITHLQRTTDFGYAMYRCKACDRTCNERTGTPFNFIEVPTDIVFQVLLCRFRYKLSFRDIAEFFLLRGLEFTHEAISQIASTVRFIDLLYGWLYLFTLPAPTV